MRGNQQAAELEKKLGDLKNQQREHSELIQAHSQFVLSGDREVAAYSRIAETLTACLGKKRKEYQKMTDFYDNKIDQLKEIKKEFNQKMKDEDRMFFNRNEILDKLREPVAPFIIPDLSSSSSSFRHQEIQVTLDQSDALRTPYVPTNMSSNLNPMQRHAQYIKDINAYSSTEVPTQLQEKIDKYRQ